MFDDSIYGCDYCSCGSVASNGDIMLVSGLDNARQAIHNQLLTLEGTYPSVDTEYGSMVSSMIGEDFTKPNLERLSVHISNALYKQPRVKSINSIEPYVTVDKKLKVNITVQLVDGSTETVKLELME